jgi:predicted DNA-binding antitoxin AbrB/MazE fold protein
MTEQVEVVYEDGVLRPLKPLPFAEKQHLIVTVSEAIAAPASYDSRTLEFEWLRVHSSAHAGKWVAIDGDRLVGEGDTAKSVLEQAR